MIDLDVEIDSRVAEIRKGEPFIIRFSLHRTREVELDKLVTAYINQAYWLVEAAKKVKDLHYKATLFGKATYSMRQAANAKWWLNT